MRKQSLRVLSLVLTALMLAMTVLPGMAASATASTIQLVKTTGTVTVANSAGRSLTKRDNMLLYNGYRVQTGAKSYAWINLDSTKLTKLDAASKVEIRKSGKKLELLLSAGHLYFNVTRPLTSGETLNIRTSTMMAGIRGTSGWVNVIDRWTTEFYVLEGSVECTVTDPVTGQTKTATVKGGQKAVAVAYPQEQEGDKCDILQEQFGVDDISGFVLEELVQDPDLCEKIYEDSGLDVRNITEEAAQDRLTRDEQELQDTLDRIEEELGEQDNNVSTDTVWGQEDAGPDDGPGPSGGSTGGGTGGGSAGDDNTGGGNKPGGDEPGSDEPGSDDPGGEEPGGEEPGGDEPGGDEPGGEEPGGDEPGGDEPGGEEPGGEEPGGEEPGGEEPGGEKPGGEKPGGEEPGDDVITETQAATKALQDLLDQDTGGSVNYPSDLPGSEDPEAPEDWELVIDGALTIPDGTTLTVERGIDIVVEKGSTLTVKGTLTGVETLTNYGTIIVTSPNTLTAALIENHGTINNTETGRIAAETLTTSNTLINAGTIEGSVVVENGGTFTMTGGEVVSSAEFTLRCADGGTLNITDGWITNNSAEGYAFVGTYGGFTNRGALGLKVRAKAVDLLWKDGDSSYATDDTSAYYNTGILSNGYCYLVARTGGSETNSNKTYWWSYENGILTVDTLITAAAAMGTYNAAEEVPWDAYRGDITTALIRNVTSIGAYAFYECTGLTGVTIPETVTGIGTYAFFGAGLTGSVTVPAKVADIGDYAFSNCTDLTAINVAEANTTFYSVDGVLFGSSGGGLRTYPAGKSDTFYTFHALPYNCTTIRPGAFYGCAALTHVNIPNCIERIGAEAFYGCSGLTTVDIPQKITSIGAGAFAGCDSLLDVYYSKTQADWGKITIGENNEPLGSAKNRYYQSGYAGDNVMWSITNGTLTLSGTGPMYDYSPSDSGKTFKCLSPPWNTGIGDAYADISIKKVVIGDGVTRIGNYAFYWLRGLTDVTIPGSVKTIGERAFIFDSAMKSVEIPEGVVEIGAAAFKECKGLESVTIPNSVTTISDLAFNFCDQLKSVTIPDGVTSIGKDAFSDCRALTSVTIPDSVTYLGPRAFRGCGWLRRVTIPGNVTSIGDNAFDGCYSLTSVTILGSVTSIGDSAFAGCSRLTSVTIPASVTSIGFRAFSDCYDLTDVFYAGSEEQWGKIKINGGNDMLNNAATVRHYNSAGPGVYTVTFDPNGGVLTGDAAAETGADGRLSALPADPTRDGWDFAGWYTEAEGGRQVTTATLFGNPATIYAHWTKQEEMDIVSALNGRRPIS